MALPHKYLHLYRRDEMLLFLWFHVINRNAKFGQCTCLPYACFVLVVVVDCCSCCCANFSAHILHASLLLSSERHLSNSGGYLKFKWLRSLDSCADVPCVRSITLHRIQAQNGKKMMRMTVTYERTHAQKFGRMQYNKSPWSAYRHRLHLLLFNLMFFWLFVSVFYAMRMAQYL